ncbi:MAG TPA: DUF5941 domain-containing protein [Catenuloplanes sp.]
MTLAVLLTATWTEVDPAAQLTGDLAAQLTAAGVRDVRVLARPPAGAAVRKRGLAALDSGDVPADLRSIAALAATADEPLLVCAGDLVAHGTLLWMLATEPAGRSSILVGPDGSGGTAVVQDRGRVVAAAGRPADAEGSDVFLGALCVAPTDLPALVAAADRAAGRAAEKAAERAIAVPGEGPEPVGGVPGEGLAPAIAVPGEGLAPVGGVPATAVDLLLVELLAGGVTPAVVPVRVLRAERVADAGELAGARAAVAAVDEDAARLRLSIKERDDFFSTYFVSTWSTSVTRWAARRGLTPSGVTMLSVALAAVAALGFWQASRPAMVAGAVLLYLSFVLDCVDGQLARYTRHFEAFGGWLDNMADRAKEYAVYAGLAAGAERAGLPGAWRLAVAAILLQTVRHMTDTWYGALHDAAAVRRAGPVARAAVPPEAAGGLGGRLSRASNRVQADTGSVAYWLKRTVVLPIGERWALLCVLAAASNGRTALLVLLVAGLFAAAYTLVLRSVRARAMRVAVLTGVDTARHRDDGPLVRGVLGRWVLGRWGRWAPGPLPMAALGVVGAAALVVTGLTPALRAGAGTVALLIATVLVLAGGLPARSPHTGALDWLVPAALRAAEYLFVVGVGLRFGVPTPIVFVLLWALAMRHYDLTARMEKAAPVTAAPGVGLGWDGRVVVLAVAALTGLAPVGVVLLVGYVVFIFGAGAIANWSVPRSVPTPMPEGGFR